ncbi:MAG TPA: peptidoglycan DD-metalloendopeptidase family protein [Xanthobacteraceae bacterium]|nr:peptidoglycan DD-metalloendopeptidase family protein [Xanthobacteraceae bacterium]
MIDHDTAQRQQARAGYTLAHAGRSFRLGPVTFWIAVGSFVIMAGWSLATGTYFAFHDDVLKRLIARQAEQQFAYEDRIAELRSQVDRAASRQLLDQEQFEQKLEQILRRQTTLESRATTLTAVPDPTPTGSIRRARPSPLPEPALEQPPLKPSPINDTVIFSVPPDREARLESRVPPPSVVRVAATPAPSARSLAGIEGTIQRLQASLDRVEVRQTAALNSLEESYDGKVKRMRGVLADLGINPAKVPPPAGVGGPFVPVKLPANAGTFERQLFRINVARTQAERLSYTFGTVPVRKPIVGEIDLSSSFGVRSDPFGRGPAMHSGLDFRSSHGDPVRATANGRVVSASWNGGYGKMVEIDHGNDITTRYGHLSDIEVKAGQTVRVGQTIGRVGSTGRSTGPHLHYETRIDGDAVDPQKFLRAGLRLGNAL